MSSGLAAVVAQFDAFKKAFDGGQAKLDESQRLMSQLKVSMLSFTSLVSSPRRALPVFSPGCDFDPGRQLPPVTLGACSSCSLRCHLCTAACHSGLALAAAARGAPPRP